jgi:hypothetical protein
MARTVASTSSPQEVTTRRIRAADEAVMTLTKPIANWQAKLSWMCACWGLIPVLGLILGVCGLVFGYTGWRRVRRRPDDLGIRHAVGGMILGGIEVLVNAVGLGLIFKGMSNLA